MNYLIILFKNRKQRKIIKKFNTFKRAKTFFDKKLKESEYIIFDKKFENGSSVEYELGIINNGKLKYAPVYKRDNLGRTIKVEITNPDKEILDLRPYRLAEKIYHVGSGKRISFEVFVKNYLPKSGIKMVSKLNHKLIVQHELNLEIFSLKSEKESDRFMDTLTDFLLKNNRMDTILVKDCSRQQRKFLYEVLTNNGYSKQSLYRQFTTHPSRK